MVSFWNKHKLKRQIRHELSKGVAVVALVFPFCLLCVLAFLPPCASAFLPVLVVGGGSFLPFGLLLGSSSLLVSVASCFVYLPILVGVVGSSSLWPLLFLAVSLPFFLFWWWVVGVVALVVPFGLSLCPCFLLGF